MTDGPLPPHERHWRHPSELAAPEPEPPTQVGRILIVATATVSLLLVGALAVTLAPRRATQSQDALVASTLLVLGGPLAAGSASTAPTTMRLRAVEPASALGFSSTIGTAGETNTAGTAGAAGETNTAGAAGPGPATTDLGAPHVATPPGQVVVTPLGGALAVTTESALIGGGARIAAVVPSGDDVIADVVYIAADIAFVLIVGSFPGDTMAVAPHDAPAGDLYLALGDSVVLVDSGTLTRASVPEGAPLVNADGALVGLCTYGPDGVVMVPVGALPGVPATGSSALAAAGSPDSSRPAPASSPAPSPASSGTSSHPLSGPPSVSTAPGALTRPGTSPATSGGAVASSEVTGSSTPPGSLDSTPTSSIDPTGSTS